VLLFKPYLHEPLLGQEKSVTSIVERCAFLTHYLVRLQVKKNTRNVTVVVYEGPLVIKLITICKVETF